MHVYLMHISIHSSYTTYLFYVLARSTKAVIPFFDYVNSICVWQSKHRELRPLFGICIYDTTKVSLTSTLGYRKIDA